MSYNENIPAVATTITFQDLPIFEGDFEWIPAGVSPVTMLMVDDATTDMDDDESFSREGSQRAAFWKHACCDSGACHNRKHDNAKAKKSKVNR